MEGTKTMGMSTSAITAVSNVGEVEQREPLVTINNEHIHHFISVPYIVFVKTNLRPKSREEGTIYCSC